MTALAGIKVVDLSRVLAGPSCSQTLADLGAEVIKIERPNIGDETRHWAPPTFADGTSAYFATVNRNKRSVTLDFTKPQGQEILKALIKEADVLVENFKVGNLAKYGLDYDSLKIINPQLIYASLTGFGQTGSSAHKPGYDYIIQGLSGLMSITGEPDGAPQKVGVAVVDLFAGMQLTSGILAALLARQQTGQGQHVDVCLMDSAIAMLANVGMNYLATQKPAKRLGNAHPNIVPYQVFTAADGDFILACGNNQQFTQICEVMGQTWHQDARFDTNPNRVMHRDTLVAQMQEKFIQQPRDSWLEKFEAVNVPCGPINSVAQALQLPQIAERGMKVEFANGVSVLGNPIKLSATPVQYQMPPPKLGEHTVAVISQLKTAAQIAELQQAGVI
ncbi:MAG: CaiB/BaiF CoA transferase family protein [Moraxella sp.]|jgi:formyl-CoA transferase